MLLTIGQLAAAAGVTVRAVRHYHRIGLLPEPSRDGSGYRRYDASAVIDLVRIKVLADAGVPLAQVRPLLEAGPAELAVAVAGIDQALEEQVGQLEQRRRQLAGLLAGDRLVLPAEAADLLDELRAIGASDECVKLERDGWIMGMALCPELVPTLAAQKRRALADAEFQRLYLACDQARGWDPADPRLEQLAGWMVEWVAHRRAAATGAGPETISDGPGISLVEQLMTAQLADASPAWHRLGQLSRSELTLAERIGLELNGLDDTEAIR